jgi:uncharacterized repeat protein (TIGR03803 family)
MSDTHFALKYFPSKLVLLAVILGLLVIVGQIARAQPLTVLHTFTGEQGDGATPYAGVILDREGNLYGTTELGGLGGGGTVFKLAPDGTLEDIFPGYLGGSEPLADLLKVKNSIYGTTIAGGTYGGGTIFELTYVPKLNRYQGETLFNFCALSCGYGYYQWPDSDLVADAQGNLYGTTRYGGNEYGTVYEVSPEGKETVLYAFCPDEPKGCTDGSLPLAGVVRDADGNLYGTTYYGGAYGGVDGYGTLFKVTPAGTEIVLHSFEGYQDGEDPSGDLLWDKEGNLYGTTLGTVFEFTAAGVMETLYVFQGVPDAIYSQAGLTRDARGNLYGTSVYGGVHDNGAVFKLTYSKKQKTYVEQVLYSFTGGADGANPYSKLVMDKAGNLYGTTEQGGDLSLCYGRGCGTVFKLTP